MGFFIEVAKEALTTVYTNEVTRGLRPKDFQPSQAAALKIQALFKDDQTLSLQEVLRQIAVNIDPDLGGKTQLGADTSKLTKDEGDALLKAATDTASQLASANPPEHILCSQSILSWHEASDVVGRRVANTFIAIQVVVRNLSPDHEFLLHDVQAMLNTSRFYGTHDHDLVRGVAEMGQVLSPRNIALNTATAIGTSVGAAYGILSVNAKLGLNIWQSGVIPGLQLIFPDNTVRQVARIDNLAFSPGSTTMVIPKNGAIGILVFLPQRVFLWPCVTPGKADNPASASKISDVYGCLPPPQAREEKWLGMKRRDQKLKDFNSAQMNRLQQSLEVLVAGVHVQEVPSNGTITDLSCAPSFQQMFKNSDSPVTCQLKGANLDKVTAVTLKDPSGGAKSLTANGTVQAKAGDNTAGTVAFPACQLTLLPKSTYQVSIVASSGDTVQKATFTKNADPLAPMCTAALKGSSIDCDFSKMSTAEAALIDTVTLSAHDKTAPFTTPITPVKLDATLKASFKDKAVGDVLAKTLPSDVTIQAQVKGGKAAIDTCVTPTTLSKALQLSLSLTGLAKSVTSGSATSFTVSATDASGTVDAGFVGKVQFTNTDKSASALPDHTFVAADKGTRQFSVTFKTKGQQTLTVTSDAAISATGSTSVGGPPTTGPKLVLDLPKSTTSGAVATVKVTVKDETGKVDAGFTGKIHFTTKDTSAVLPADYTFTAADKGTHQFSVTFKTKGVQTLTLASNGVKSASGSTTVK